MAVSALPAESVIVGVVWSRSRRIVPLPEPVLTVTIQAVPEPLTEVTEAPVTPLAMVVEKLPLATPVTASEKVTAKVAVDDPVGLEVPSAIELTVGWVSSSRKVMAVPVVVLLALSITIA